MKKRNPLKGLAAHESKVAARPVRAKVDLKKEKTTSSPKTEKEHASSGEKVKKKRVLKERNNYGELSIAGIKRAAAERRKAMGYDF